MSTTTRSDVAGAARVVVKVGSSSLTTAAGGIDPGRVRALVDTLAGVRARGAEVVLVSSGAIAAGLAPLGLTHRPRDLATQQAAASVGQGLLVHRYTEEFARHGLGVGQVLLTVDDMTRRSHYRNAYRTFAKLLELGVLPIVNENDTVATGEIRFGDNDRLAALVAHLVHAELLLLLSDVDGLYDGHPDAVGTTLLSDVTSEEDLDDVRIGGTGSAGVGTGGMQTKVEAARIATGAGIPVVLTSADNAARALAGDDVGTMFHPTGRRRPTRLLWLAHATEPKGQVVLDEGAVRAVVDRRASLLAAGVTGVRGTFVGGDPVDLVDPHGVPVARGLVNYDSDELPDLVGRSTHELARELGSSYEREVVHRDDLVLLHRR
ncbi:glutamate 5-kinase [Nocardioides sp. WL0053]|uniref:Glutamate 5-kinase n=1 Tax=Nocardioides jiangsuensis TaxID=2866161 RepID=A0ABS7RNV0_9ACTN|nr:glutamate 5-kinase [Nocardioides jiangsuensis]MBY9076730.1 glutamate 5-kinase [Nocardioides jiangsuensis]